MTYEDYQYYSAYSREELAEFFSMKKELVWNMQQALSWSTNVMVIVIPILLIVVWAFGVLELINDKNPFNITVSIIIMIIVVGLSAALTKLDPVKK